MSVDGLQARLCDAELEARLSACSKQTAHSYMHDYVRRPDHERLLGRDGGDSPAVWTDGSRPDMPRVIGRGDSREHDVKTSLL